MWYLREMDGTLASTGETSPRLAEESAAEMADLMGIDWYELVWRRN